jgi:ketosteroid isomerase-like protein
MRKLFAIVLILMGAAAFASASDQDDAMKSVRQFVDGFNKGDAKSALAACADQVFIIDEFPPYQWSGSGACSTWANDYDADAKKNGITDALVTLGKPGHVDLTGDNAYVVVPATYTWKQKGKPMKETNAMFTLVLHRESAGWRITSWSWAKH